MATSSIGSSSIQSAGIGSGLDISSIVSQLVAAEKQPQTDRLDAQQTKLQTRLSSLGTLQSALSTFQDSAFTLWKSETFNSRTVSSSSPDVATATATTGVMTGLHQVSVDQLAQAQRLSTNPAAGAQFTSASDVLGTGTLTFRFGTTTVDTNGYSSFSPNPDRNTATVQITDGSLNGIASAINGAGIGVTASVIFDGTNYRLMLSGNDTGAANSMEITAADDDGNNQDAKGLSLLDFNSSAANMDQIQAAQNTTGLVVDGISMTSASNTLDQAISGMTINLLTPGSTTVTVGVDQSKATQAISDFVTQYNAMINTINSLSSYDASSGTAGPLLGDSVLFSAESQIRNVMGQVFGSSGSAFRQLADIGITRNPADGTLVLDSDKLQAAMGQDYNGVSSLMSAYGKPMDDLMTKLLASNGIFQTATDSINSGLKQISDQRDEVDQRSQQYESMLNAQFTAMDTLVAQLRSTSDYLTQQFAALNNTSNQNK